MLKYRVDLRSDTVSVPSTGMRSAMAHAEVGDDVFGEDPTVNALQNRVASLLGFEASLFMPSGTMSNGVALRTLASPGDEVICGSSSHVYLYEGAQAALNAGMQLHRIDEGPGGLPAPEEIEAALSRSGDIHFAPRSLVCLENTHNILGGIVLPRSEVERIQRIASACSARMYLDGARIWHASAASGTPVADLCRGFDMVSVCFSKALGCPVGSVLAGSRGLVERARWWRKRHGGGMRQAGILAAACMHALDHNLPRLPVTHKWARQLARAAASSPMFRIEPDSVETNIVILGTREGVSSSAAVTALTSLGIGCLAVGPDAVRLVTHLSMDERDVKYATDILSSLGG